MITCREAITCGRAALREFASRVPEVSWIDKDSEQAKPTVSVLANRGPPWRTSGGRAVCASDRIAARCNPHRRQYSQFHCEDQELTVTTVGLLVVPTD